MNAGFRWYIADAMTPAHSTAPETSHESLCLLNDSRADASVVLTAFFEHAEPETSAKFIVPAKRSVHLRLDDPARIGGLRIPVGVPYGLVVDADARLALQYSRLDTAQSAYALMSVVPPAESRNV